MSKFKSGFVAIVGRPNTGKSTLLNAIIGEKLAIVSNKPQTTRNAILTIKTTDNYQLIFVDTPGVHRPKTKLGEHMIKAVTDAITDVDAAILVCDATKEIGAQEKEIIQKLISRKIPAVLAVNKVDKVSKEKLLPLIAEYMNLYQFAAVVPMAALHRRGTDTVINEVLALMPEGPMYYPADQITDQPEKQIVAETIREKMLRLLDREVPHGTAVEIEKFKNEDDLLTVEAAIICEKATHKAIIIGKNGEMIKRIGSYARADMEKFFDKKVFLKTWVKVRQDWRNKEKSIRELGY